MILEDASFTVVGCNPTMVVVNEQKWMPILVFFLFLVLSKLKSEIIPSHLLPFFSIDFAHHHLFSLSYFSLTLILSHHSSSSKVDDAVRAADQKDSDRDRRRRSRSRDRDTGRGGGGSRGGDDRGRDLREDTRGGDRDRDGRGGGEYVGPRGRGGDSRAGMGRRGESLFFFITSAYYSYIIH